MCTGIRFTGKNGSMFFGRNLDWGFSYGEKVYVTPREFKGLGACGSPIALKYPVIGMGILENNFPLYFDCANEAGLAVAGLNFPGFATYEEKPVSGKTNIAAFEFPFWVASQFKTVDEAEAALQNVAIVGIPVGNYPVALLHWLIADKDRSIVVEYMSDGMHIHHNDVDVLTNQPTFDWQRENLRNYLSATNEFPQPVVWNKAELTAYGSGSGMRGIPGDYYSPSRFVRVAYLNAHYPAQDGEAKNVSRLFHTLSSIAMIEGAACMDDGSFEKTIYTGGFSAEQNTYYYSTYENPAIYYARMSDYDTSGQDVIEAQVALFE